MKRQSAGLVLSVIMLLLLTYGCGDIKSSPQNIAAVQQQSTSVLLYQGRVLGKSNKAKLISLEIDNGDGSRIVHFTFDANTKGMEYAVKGYGVGISCEKRGDKIYAALIKPEPVKMVSGVKEFSVAEVQALIKKNEDFELIDSRPTARFATAHLPGAISIPVTYMPDSLSMLPEDKKKLLVFYCGGPI